MENLLNGILIGNNTLPQLPRVLDGGTIIDVAGDYYLVLAFSQLWQKDCYHIVKLTACGKGWCNGRYDIQDHSVAKAKLAELWV